MSEKERNQIVLVGDIHGEFATMEYNIRTNGIENAYIIQVGDFGMGFHADGYYAQMLGELNSKLEKSNNHLYAIRGNHDDPRFFETTNNPFGLKNITLLADYSELHLLDKKILCVGGAVSIDRFRRIIGKSWWPGEPFVFNETAVMAGSKEFDAVVTHTRPAVCGSFKGFGKIEWIFPHDPPLKEDLINEGNQMDLLYGLIMPKNWFYGHFHESNITEFEGTIFRCLNIHEIVSLY